MSIALGVTKVMPAREMGTFPIGPLADFFKFTMHLLIWGFLLGGSAGYW